MFPRLNHHVYQQIVDKADLRTPVNIWRFYVWNESGWDAVDVEGDRTPFFGPLVMRVLVGCRSCSGVRIRRVSCS
jgi:hypothetical protein